MEFMAAVGVAFGAIFLAEFGDKSQLLILAFATRHRAAPVIAGLVVAASVIQGIAVVVGATIGAVLPEDLVGIVAGVAFLGVAAWTLWPDDDEPQAAPAEAARGRLQAGVGVALAVAGAFILAEIGDKTMLATFALAASQGPLATWVGSVGGEIAANLVAVVVGRRLGSRLSPRTVRIGSAALFALGGILVLTGVLLR